MGWDGMGWDGFGEAGSFLGWSDHGVTSFILRATRLSGLLLPPV